MKIDTLILSGGSVKGIALLGAFKYLLDNKKIRIKKLKHIISASAGALMSLPLLLNVNINVYYKIITGLKVNLFKKDDLHIKNLINEYGFFDNSVVEEYVRTFIKYFVKKDNITLIELFKLTKIKFTVKVSNITKNNVEYINYLNNPNMDLVTLIKITTSVPIIFKPVKYNNFLYCDGATGGGLPIEYNTSPNYLGIILYPYDNLNLKIVNILDYFSNLIHVFKDEDHYNHYKKYKNIICIDLKISVKLDITEKESINFFKIGYIETEKFLKKK